MTHPGKEVREGVGGAAGTPRRAKYISGRNRTLTVWCTPEQLASIDRAATARGMSRAQFARLLMNAGMRVVTESGQ